MPSEVRCATQERVKDIFSGFLNEFYGLTQPGILPSIVWLVILGIRLERDYGRLLFPRGGLSASKQFLNHFEFWDKQLSRAEISPSNMVNPDCIYS